MKTIDWSPINLLDFKASDCVYVGEAGIYKQDHCSGSVSHGERKRATPIYGYQKDNLIHFIAAYNVTDKHEALKIDGEHNIAGGVQKTGRYLQSNYKIGFTCHLLHLESQSTKNAHKNIINSDISHFTGTGRLSYVPWSELVDIKVTYYLYKQYLAYITFDLTKDQYNNWLSFKDLHMYVYDHGNTNKCV